MLTPSKSWRSIETAPRVPDANGDPIYVLLFRPPSFYVIAHWSQSTLTGKWGWDDGDTRSGMTEFTHWQPLMPPETPEAA